MVIVLLVGYMLIAIGLGIENRKLPTKYAFPESGDMWYNARDQTIHIMSDSCHTVYRFQACNPSAIPYHINP